MVSFSPPTSTSHHSVSCEAAASSSLGKRTVMGWVAVRRSNDGSFGSGLPLVLPGRARNNLPSHGRGAAGRGASGGQRAARKRRGGLPPRRGGARRPRAADARRRDRRALGLDRLAVPAVQLAAAVRDRPAGASSYRALPQLRLRTGEDADGMAFEELGYASAAIESYRTFSRLKRDGVVPPGCRFLVSLPTPLAPVSAFVALEYQAELEPVYEAQMHKEVEHILAAIPADQLAIQWDARYEFAMLEGAIAVWFEDVQAGVVERLARLGAARARRVELGFHLCYGDDEHGHFAEPEDAGRLVGVANALAAALDRPLNWIHMPVPEERDDDAYYAPLGELRAPARDRAVPRPDPRRRPRRGRAAPDRRGPQARGRVRRRDGVRLGPRRRRRRDRAAGAAPRPDGAAARRRRARRGRALQLARRLRADPRRGLDEPRRRRGGDRLRPRRRARLVPQPRRHRRGARAGRCATATSCSTTRAAPGSCSTGCGCGCSTARSAW